MAGSSCVFCHGDIPTNSCHCDLTATLHCDIPANSNLGLSNPQPFLDGHQYEWPMDVDLSSLFDDQGVLAFEGDVNPITGFQDDGLSHSIDPKLNEQQISASHLQPAPSIPSVTVLDNGANSRTTFSQDGALAGLLPANSRRRDYTKEEKEAFEQWITSCPNPNRAQRVQYAQKNGLEKSQVDNLINNRRRDLRKAEAAVGMVPSAVNSNGLAGPRRHRLRDNGSLHLDSPAPEHDTDMDAYVITPFGSLPTSSPDERVVLPVSEENLKRSSNARSSYSSLDEYLRSPEEATPIEIIQRVIGRAGSAALEIMPKKRLARHMLGPNYLVNCCLCKRLVPLGDKIVIFPCQRWFHEACIASYLNLCTSSDACPVCCQSIHGESQDPCPAFGSLLSITNPGENSETFKGQINGQIADLTFRRTSQQSLRRNPSSQNLRRRNSSNVSSAHGSRASSVASGTSAHSYASSASRIRAKKIRREKRLKSQGAYTCSFCNANFTKSHHMRAHEIEEHCLPQTFPCTFCHQRFESPAAWEKHETQEHCEVQVTWFCMLDADVPMVNCPFCVDIWPDVDHYERVHFLSPCNRPLVDRTFNTKQYLMGHLIEAHEMTEEEVMQLSDHFRLWALKLNIKDKLSGGVWRCGYCGVMGVDWEERVRHIIGHWKEGGPRFTKVHRWNVGIATVKFKDSYIQRLATSMYRRQMRPFNMPFPKFEMYAAATEHRAGTLNSQASSFGRQLPRANLSLFLGDISAMQSPEPTPSPPPSPSPVDKMDDLEISPNVKPISPPASSSFLGNLFASLADRRKAWSNFAKGKRKGNKSAGRNAS